MLDQLSHHPLTPSDGESSHAAGPIGSETELLRTSSGRVVRTVQEELSDAVTSLASCVELLKVIQHGVNAKVIPNLSFRLGKASDIIIPGTADDRKKVSLEVALITVLAMAGCES
jgi:hypothetical protein